MMLYTKGIFFILYIDYPISKRTFEYKEVSVKSTILQATMPPGLM